MAQSGEQPKLLATISPTSKSPREHFQLFLASLRGLGWIEGHNLRLRTWFLERSDQFGAAAAEAVAASPDLILAVSSIATASALQRTHTIPVLFALVTDPLGQHFVPSFRHPGGNVTGFTDFEPSLGSKWLQTLQTIAPQVDRVLTLFDSGTGSGPGRELPSIASAARTRGVQLTVRIAHGMREVEVAVSSFAGAPDRGLILAPDVYFTVHQREIIALAARYRLPAVFGFQHWVENGGLISYGPDLDEVYRNAAAYADRILRGARPGDLPVQNPTKYQFGVNLKTAKALGLTVPQSLLLAADEIVR
jgi:putative ABC transport system substrate-binding protein